MQRPLLPSQLLDIIDAKFPGFKIWYQKNNNWLSELFSINNNCMRPVHLLDAAAENDTVYFSLTTNKMAYKSSAGVVSYFW